MGIYLNNKRAYTLYKNETKAPYFIDKSMMLQDMIDLLEQGNQYICVVRPRRFGKTVVANMIASYLSKGKDSYDIFNNLYIASNQNYEKHINKHNVIHVSFNEKPDGCSSYEKYIKRIKGNLIKDLQKEYSQYNITSEEEIWDALSRIYEEEDTSFVFVLDEWDYIFHQNFATEEDRESFIGFISNLLKDKPYVELAYMTGILPISKYSSGSELNVFREYTIATKAKYAEYFGFTDEEVDELYRRYIARCENPNISREDLRLWYDGYRTQKGIRMYNPRSVVCALGDNQLSNYWTSAGPYDEIFYYINYNIDEIRDDLGILISGEAIDTKIQEYAVTSMNLRSKEEIFSAMIVFGFLTYEDGKVRIPNKELMDQFRNMICKETSLGYINQLAKLSEEMLHATLAQDTDKMVKIIESVHNTESPLFQYNHEIELTAIVNLAYLSARDYYRIEREEKSGIGYVDFIFYPYDINKRPGIILELKVDDTPESALKQIEDREYISNFRKNQDHILCNHEVILVGMAYNKIKKHHECKIKIENI